MGKLIYKFSRHAYLAGLLLAMLLGAHQDAMAGESNRATEFSVQQKSLVKGTVLDQQGEPLIGATVVVDGTTHGVVTDIDGNFQIDAPKDAKLKVSYIGCKTKIFPLGGKAEVTVTLENDASQLEEVVVVGYGTQKKATMTGAVSVVGEKQMEGKGSLSSPVQALQGQVPGVIITRGSSAPGEEGWKMSLRGAVSKNSTEPLVIIDGVEYESVNELRLLNPSDIESINFLKDAAASIYGSKAAGGVVLVVTKKAKEGKVKVDYSGSVTLKTPGLAAKLMSLDEWSDAVIQARTNDGYDDSDTWLRYAKLAQKYRNTYIDFDHSKDPLGLGDVDDLTFFDTDWQDIMWGNAASTQHELAVSGGKEGNTFRLSLGYMYDGSNLKWGKNNNQRTNLRLSNSFALSKRLKLESVIGYNRQDQVAPTQIAAALTTSSQQPGFPASTIDGKPYGWGGSKWATPNWLCQLGGNNRLNVSAVNISETLHYDITKGLKATAVLGYNTSTATRDIQSKAVDFYNYAGTRKIWQKPAQADSYTEASTAKTDFYSFQGFLNYNKTFKEDHDLTVMAGMQYNLKQYSYNKTRAKDIQPSLDVINGQGEVSLAGTNKWEEAILSYFSRVNYAYKSRYMVEAQARYDGSSKFQSRDRWAFFWGTSIGWRITEEKFMQPVKSWLDDLKLRTSYGEVGNQSGIDRYSGVQLYNFHQGAGALIGGEKLSYFDTNGKLVSRDRTWERVKNYNIGLDAVMLQSRLSLTVEAFWKNVDNMLIDVRYPGILGDSAPTANKGKFKAWGYEGSLTWRDKIGNVNYHVGGTFTFADNELTDNGGSGAIKSGVRSDREGYPLNSVFGLRYCGKIQTEEQLQKYKERYQDNSSVGNIRLLRLGDNMYEDLNKDGKLDASDYAYLGTDDPKIQFSVNHGAEYRGFDVDVVFQGAAKRTVWRTDGNGNADIWRIPMRAVYMNSSNSFVGNVWSLDNPSGRYPSLTNQSDINTYNYQCSSWSVEDGSYLRCKNITLGYTFPASWLKKTNFLTSVRLYLTGTDLFEISKIHDGWDPEAARTITSSARYPFLRTFTFGANVSF